MLGTVLITLMFLYLCVLFVKRLQMVQMLEKIPGPSSWPIIGIALEVAGLRFREFTATLDKYALQHEGGMYRMYVGLQPYVVLYRSDLIEPLLTSNSLLSKSSDYTYFGSWLGKGLLTSTGNKWRSRRKLLTPAFHFKILENFTPVFNEQAMKLVNKIGSMGDAGIDFQKLSVLCTLEIIHETALGTTLNALDDEENEYLKAIVSQTEIVATRLATPWLQPDILFKFSKHAAQEAKNVEILHKCSLDVIRNRRQKLGSEMEESCSSPRRGKTRLAFLDLLLQHSEQCSEPLTDVDLLEEVNTVMFAGHDTSATTLNFALFFIARHPKVQEKVQKELDDVVGGDKIITLDHINKLKLLDCVIKETLRLIPVAPFISRAENENTVIGGYTIPKETILAVLIYRLHRDPRYFPDPETFDPDRFLPENTVNHHPFCHVPFSAGPRNCIGQKFGQIEMKVLLAHLLINYKVDCQQTLEEVGLMYHILLKTKKPILIKFKKRL